MRDGAVAEGNLYCRAEIYPDEDVSVVPCSGITSLLVMSCLEVVSVTFIFRLGKCKGSSTV